MTIRVWTVVMLLLAGVVSTHALDAPDVQLTTRLLLFPHLNEQQSDTHLTAGWSRISFGSGISMGLVGNLRYDSAGTRTQEFDEFSRQPKQPILALSNLSLTVSLLALWENSNDLLGGDVVLQVGKFVFPLPGAGDTGLRPPPGIRGVRGGDHRRADTDDLRGIVVSQ